MKERELQGQHDGDLEDVPDPEEKVSDPEEEIRGEVHLGKERTDNLLPPVATETLARRT